MGQGFLQKVGSWLGLGDSEPAEAAQQAAPAASNSQTADLMQRCNAAAALFVKVAPQMMSIDALENAKNTFFSTCAHVTGDDESANEFTENAWDNYGARQAYEDRLEELGGPEVAEPAPVEEVAPAPAFMPPPQPVARAAAPEIDPDAPGFGDVIDSQDVRSKRGRGRR